MKRLGILYLVGLSFSVEAGPLGWFSSWEFRVTWAAVPHVMIVPEAAEFTGEYERF